MRKSFVALTLLVGAAAALASTAFARVDELGGDDATPKLINAQMAREMRSSVVRAGMSSHSTGDTTYVGYVPGKVTATNYWGIGIGKFVPYDSDPDHYGYWAWDDIGANASTTELHGDSLWGWWPYRNLYTSTGGLTLPDDQRPWWAIDIGNNANYKIGVGNFRTFGVVGVWHVDNGSASGSNVTWNTSDWGGGAGGNALWCGLRQHGDLSYSDDQTGNPFNAQVLANSGLSGGTTGGGVATNQLFPGYGSQWDQLAYRDIDVTGASTIQLKFNYRTRMSTAYGTTAATRTGWFDKDPLGPADQLNPLALNNFISSSAAGASAPIDSFMVYVGAAVGYAAGSTWKGSDAVNHTIYDPARRWLSETIRVNEAAVPYHEVFTTFGDNTVAAQLSLTAAIDASWSNKARVVFRSKTNRGFDDEAGSVLGSYSSAGGGAVVIDDVEYSLDAGSFVSLGDFESAGDVDNDTAVDPLDAWKTTGKPMAVFDHVHNIGDLIYEDLCGVPGDALRICNLDGNVISSGDHDNSERAGGTFGTAEQELNNGIMSPTINFVNGGGTNEQGLDPLSAEPTEDYYIFYDMYTGIYDFVNQGGAWRFAYACYPGRQLGGVLCWGDWRFPGFIIFNPDKQCFQDFEGGYQNALIRFSFADAADNAFGFYPDSIRIQLGKVQQCFRFGLPSANCSPTDGSYFDNVSLAIIDGIPAPMSIDIWQLINDTFTVNGGTNRANILPGTADFDTTTALVKIGLNITQTTNTNARYNVPGDTTTVNADGDDLRMDMVFRIAPGPGNYSVIGDKTSALRLVPTSATAVSEGAPQTSPPNFWEQYLIDNGFAGTPGGHPVADKWDPLVWNSARCDSAEINLYTIVARTIGIPVAGAWSSMYIEDDPPGTEPKFVTLGIEKNRCFLILAGNAVTQANTTCDLTNPFPGGGTDGWETTSGYGQETGRTGLMTHGHTYEFTKIMPDGQFTPGTHVQYFFRREDAGGSGGPCEAPDPCMAPDTNVVFPQAGEGSTDAHRWQQFSVLPDAWKFDSYDGLGQACMLYVDVNDRRGNERVWVSIADSLGATNAAKYGAHNGWHAPGTGTAAVNQTSSFVRNLNEQPGTTWDMYGTKASESLNSKAGSIGSWNGNHAASAVDGKWSYLGPSIGMLTAYYKVMLILSGDLNSTIIGPGLNFGSDDVLMIQDFLADGSSGEHRGVFVEGDGWVEANQGVATGQLGLMTNWFKVSLRDPSYLTLSGNDDLCLDLIPSAPISTTDIYGVRNGCLFTDDVLQVESGGTQSARYSPGGNGANPKVAGVFHDVQGSEFYQSVVDGWDIENLRSRYCDGPRGRQWYYYNVLTNIFGKICTITGTGGGVNDVPNGGAQEFVDFMNLRNNPLVAGSAKIDLVLSKADRVEVKVFDVSGRLMRTLADRQFAIGPHTLIWDGVDNAGRQVARGVYFTQVKFVNNGFTSAKKLTVLK